MANTTAPVSPSPVSLNASTTFPSAAGKPTIFLRRFIHLLACFRCASWAHPFAGLFKVDGPGTGTTPDSTVGANTSQHTANLRPLSRVTSHRARERGRRIGTGAAEQGAWSGETAALWGSCLALALTNLTLTPTPTTNQVLCVPIVYVSRRDSSLLSGCRAVEVKSSFVQGSGLFASTLDPFKTSSIARAGSEATGARCDRRGRVGFSARFASGFPAALPHCVCEQHDRERDSL